MSEEAKGKAFFDRADQVAETGNWDFAIEMYLQGIQREPENIQRGHQLLREVSLKRKLQGGKPAGLGEKIKHRTGKDPLQNLLSAEYLLAKDPGSESNMEQVLAAAVKLPAPAVVKWICDILMESQRQAAKKSKRLLALLTQSYQTVEEYGLALQACEMAHQLSPNDEALQEQLRELSARYTIKQGRYDQDGTFTKSVKDLDKQKEMIQADSLVKDRSYLQQQIDKTRQEYLEAPTVAGKINSFVDALLKPEQETFENEAIDVLAKAHKDTSSYQFKMRIGDVRIRQMTRQYRKLVAQGDKQAAAEHARKQLELELEEFGERAANYPTDLGIKFDLGRRQFLAGKFDDAIGSLQQAKRDPRRHVLAMNYLGQAFAHKGWFREAADTFQAALQSEVLEEQSKELHYHLGDVLERMEDFKGAQDEFSQVAQMDYNYRDVRARLEAIRAKLG